MAQMFFFARFHAQVGQEGAVAAAMAKVLPPSRAEPGCLAIDAYRDTRDPQLFYIHSRWVDEAAFERHAALSHTRDYIATVEPLLDQPPEFARTQPIAETAP